MRIIKFRGLDINSNKFVYGYFFKCGFRFCIVVDNPNGNGQTIYHVQPSSVVQLVWIDSNGNEIYEGDLITDQYGDSTSVARLWATAVDESDDIEEYCAFGSPMDGRDFVLKEAAV